MKRILVTGATGFIGNHVINELLRKGHEVIASSASVDKAKKQRWYNDVRYIPFDLAGINSNQDYYTFFCEPDVLIHLAWEGLPNYKAAFHLEQNLPRHYRFLKNLVENGLNDITVTGTCFEYGLREGCLSEDLTPMPSNVYATAKNELRLLLNELAKDHPYSLKWARLFYMYGKGQNPNSLLSQLQAAIDRGDSVFNMSPGDQLRDYLPVEMVADYIITIALQNKVTGIINCCSGKPVVLKEFVEDYIKKQNAVIALNLGYYPYSDIEPKDFWGDTKKINQILINE